MSNPAPLGLGVGEARSFPLWAASWPGLTIPQYWETRAPSSLALQGLPGVWESVPSAAHALGPGGAEPSSYPEAIG